MVRFGVMEPLTRTNGLILDSIQEALWMYFQPIKSDDPQLDFYTMYKRETVEYDTKCMQKHKDLNNTLIFVRVWILLVATRVDHNFRLTCSPRSVPPLPSMSSPGSSQALANGLKPTSVCLFSPIIRPLNSLPP